MTDERRINIRVDGTSFTRYKTKIAQEGTTFQDLIAQFLADWEAADTHKEGEPTPKTRAQTKGIPQLDPTLTLSENARSELRKCHAAITKMAEHITELFKSQNKVWIDLGKKLVFVTAENLSVYRKVASHAESADNEEHHAYQQDGVDHKGRKGRVI